MWPLMSTSLPVRFLFIWMYLLSCEGQAGEYISLDSCPTQGLNPHPEVSEPNYFCHNPYSRECGHLVDELTEIYNSRECGHLVNELTEIYNSRECGHLVDELTEIYGKWDEFVDLLWVTGDLLWRRRIQLALQRVIAAPSVHKNSRTLLGNIHLT